MIRAIPSLNRDGNDVWLGQYRTGRFWHTVRDEDGRAVHFSTEGAATVAAREEYADHHRLHPLRVAA